MDDRKVAALAQEIDFIKDDKIRNFAKVAVSSLPDYFFEVAASSTGKYHPSYALGEGGLLRHTKAAVRIANDLLSLEMYGSYSQMEKDIMILGLILHDGLKHGETLSPYTIAEHPIVCASWIKDTLPWKEYLSYAQVVLLCEVISSHMGQWNTSYKTNEEILPKPRSRYQKFVHQCDYLASRKYLEFNFNV